MTENRENSTHPGGVRKRIKAAARVVGVRAPKRGTKEEMQVIEDFVAQAQHRKSIDELLKQRESEGDQISPDHLEPIVVDENTTDPRLRKDEAKKSPLTPEQVVDSFPPCKDEKTGMPKIPRKRNLQPWEGVSHQ